ncbi:MAG: MFS transporter [Lentisphaerae bacterium]|nr:MFS transporter [Lentisphaerota bacterium]
MNPKLVRRYCYVAIFVQAMVINLTPLFFIPLRNEFGLSFEQLGRLVLINFCMQMLVDLLCTAVLDRAGWLVKPLMVLAQLFAVTGLWVFAGTPFLFSAAPYHGLVTGTVILSLGCGLQEVLTSPIINALPSTRKEADMALLHAFYPIGKVVAIAVTAVAIVVLGHGSWRWIAMAWSAVPFLNMFGFASITLPELSHPETRLRSRDMANTGFFWLAMFGILFAGASEVTLAQWTSAFAQAALGIPQFVADCVGFGLFAFMMVIGRLWFGLRSETMSPRLSLLIGAGTAILCYAAVALLPSPTMALICCILAGLSVSMLWPSIVSYSAATFPLAGVSMFALLAAFGDVGAGFGPWLVGAVADQVSFAESVAPGLWQSLLPQDLTPDQLGLRAGLLVAGICPLILLMLVFLMRDKRVSQKT